MTQMCPMRYNGKWDCIEDRCAWWDKETNQCAIFVLAKATQLIENKKMQRIKIEKNDWGKDI